MSVNVQVNEKLKEQDVNNKLQLYGIYSACANGKVPSVSLATSTIEDFTQACDQC
jgi:hypothetical protein